MSSSAMWKLKQELARSLGSAELDPESQVGRAVRMLRADLVDDLGGPDHISTAESILIDATVRTALILGAVDSWLLRQETLLVGNKVKRLQPVARERTTILDSLGRCLRTLGTRRREGAALDLDDYLLRGKSPNRQGGGPGLVPEQVKPPQARAAGRDRAGEAARAKARKAEAKDASSGP